MTDRLLLLGGSSFMGQAIIKALGSGRSFGTYLHHPFPGGCRFDPLSGDLETILHDHGPFSHAMILFGLTKPDQCASNPQLARRLNVDATKRIVDVLVTRNVTPVFFSSEVVFNGLKGNYSEIDVPNPLMEYGKLKIEIERFCQQIEYPILIVRLARVMGTRYHDGSLFMEILSDLMAGRRIDAALDSRFSPIHVDDATRAILRLIDVGAEGIVHVAGPEAASRWEMVQLLIDTAKSAGLPVTAPVFPCYLSDINTIEPRPRDISLSIERLQALTGIRPRNLRAIVESCVESALADHQHDDSGRVLRSV